MALLAILMLPIIVVLLPMPHDPPTWVLYTKAYAYFALALEALALKVALIVALVIALGRLFAGYDDLGRIVRHFHFRSRSRGRSATDPTPDPSRKP